MDNAEKLLWKYVINNGYVIEDKSYYGNTSDIDRTHVIRNNLNKINWDKSTPIKQDTDYQFSGTFSDDIPVKFLYGKLSYMNKVYEFYLDLDDMPIIDLIKSVLGDELDG